DIYLQPSQNVTYLDPEKFLHSIELRSLLLFALNGLFDGGVPLIRLEFIRQAVSRHAPQTLSFMKCGWPCLQRSVVSKIQIFRRKQSGNLEVGHPQLVLVK